jgi:spore cortex biosynthesis protein YabQ
MISRELYGQALLLAGCLGLGGWLMFCYDLLRISRLLLPRKNWIVSLEDFIYWIYVALSAFSLLYRQNDGILRGYVIAGMFFGMAGYDWLISQNVMKLLQKAIKRIKIKRKKTSRKKGKNKDTDNTTYCGGIHRISKSASKTVDIKSGDAYEEFSKTIPAEKAGQVGKPDGADRRYRGSAQPGCSDKFKKRISEGEGSGIPDSGRKPAETDCRGKAEKGRAGGA